MSDTMIVCRQSVVCDSFARWLGEELKALNTREAKILRLAPGEERDRLLFDLQDEFAEIRVALKDLQERREAAERETL